MHNLSSNMIAKEYDIKTCFKGIPKAQDYVAYNEAYYKSVKAITVEKHGESATMLEAKEVMNLHGNTCFFKWFPDLYATEEKMGRFWQPQFHILKNNRYSDFLHGITHIRSRSSHTNMGECLLIPDNFYSTGVKYADFSARNKDKKIEDCTETLFDEAKIYSQKTPHQKLIVLNTIFFSMHFYYDKLYKEGLFKADFPEEKVSQKFLFAPRNQFEERLSLNLVRAIYMDEKYKMYSSTQTAFIHTPVSVSSKESYRLLFTTEEEDHWIYKIADIIKMDQYFSKLQSIVNTSWPQSNDEQKLAVATIKEMAKYFIPKSTQISP